jgi:diguanylate cyclase (GGDEF)-like protein/PAS domain S-box-containing protein
MLRNILEYFTCTAVHCRLERACGLPNRPISRSLRQYPRAIRAPAVLSVPEIETESARMRVIPSILLLGSTPGLGMTVQEALAEIGRGAFVLERVARLSEGIERLKKAGVDAILAYLSLPDSQGIGTLESLLRAAPHVPILILAGHEDENLAHEVLQRGAQDYLLNGGRLDCYTLGRALRGAISRKGAEDALFAEKERAQVTLNSIGDAVLSTDMSGNVTYLNVVAERMTGWPSADAVGRPLTEIFQVVDAKTHLPAPNPMELAVRKRQTVALPANTNLVRRDGIESAIEDSAAPIHDRHGTVTGAVIVFHDVSESRAMTLKMSHLAQHDFLTNLPNRLLLHDRLTHCIAVARRHDRALAVLFVDLDRFKLINDSLGHPIGDLLLKAAALRLVSCVRDSDTVSRQGGDEFVVLLSEISRAEDAALTAEKMRVAVLAPYAIANHDLHLSASIGISVYPDDGQDSATLIKNADTAMYHAKDSGRNNYQFFRHKMNVRAVERQFIEAGLRHALDRHEFVLFYQPIVILATGEITGAEALIRWRHPERGVILPVQFMAVAEESGLIGPIGQWALREACRQARDWIDAGLNFRRMAVNMSAVEFRSSGYYEAVCTVLRETRLEPHCLELELTETVLLHDVGSASVVLHSLSALGIRIAVDDFGTGYSSLTHLRQFPIDTLKVDQSFVRHVVTDPDDAAIVGAVIAMGQRLKLRVVAEGVETREQLHFLKAEGCIEGQGYYFSRPMPPDSVRVLLEADLLGGSANDPIIPIPTRRVI